MVERSLFRAGDKASLIKTIVIDPFAKKTDSSVEADSPSPDQDAPPSRPSTEPSALGQAPVHNSADVPRSVWPIDLKAKLQAEELRWLTTALDVSEQRQGEAAALLGLTYDQMRALVRKHRLTTRPRRNSAV